jgi:peptidoglycan/LPS O-acetylase OafA/YrhL
MESSKKYYKDLNIIRLVACIAVLFYHLGLLKGGYLAVCTFFVLTGYLSVVSSFKKKAFSIKEYYKNRLIKVYIPLVIVVFITIGVTSFFKNVYWISLKNETTSVLLGYNNFWQISANLDYFARHVDSPFMHLWYIGILLQFELIFPFLFKLLKKSGEKIDKIMPCIIPLVFATASIIYFLIASHSSNIMNAYYNTFARCFSIFFGVSLGFIHSYYKPLIPKKIKKGGLSKVLFYIYLGISLILFIFVKSTSNLFTISMILVTLISCRLIDYGTTNKSELNIFDKIVKRVSDISYEIYLIQYPVIYLSQYININHHLKTPLIIIVTIILSYILNMATRKRKKIKVTGIILLIVIIGASTFGGYKYITVKNHQKEMKELEAELAENAKIMEEKQKEYQQIKQQEENDWTKELKKLESEANYEELTKALPVTFIGDSVMLGAMNNLHETFPNSYFDSKESRSTYVGYQIISELKENNKLGDPVVIHLGTNGDCKNGCKEKIMDLLTDRTVFWINTTNMPSVNESLNELSTKYSNLHIIDWYTLSQGQKDWFYSDGIHLPPKGRREYTNIVYNAIYNVYKDNFKTKKDELIKEHKEELKNKTMFYGNDILFYNFEAIQTNFSDAKFEVKKEFSYLDLKASIEKAIAEDTLSKKIVIAFDNSTIISTKEYQELIELCKDSKLYIVSSGKPLDSLSKYDNVEVINFYSKIQKNKDYLMADGIHLTEKGNEALLKLLDKKLN